MASDVPISVVIDYERMTGKWFHRLQSPDEAVAERMKHDREIAEYEADTGHHFDRGPFSVEDEND